MKQEEVIKEKKKLEAEGHRVYGLCSTCEIGHMLTKEGKIRRHGSPRCDGTGTLPTRLIWF